MPVHLEAGRNLIQGFATCLRCRQFIMVFVEVECDWVEEPHKHTKHLAVKPNVRFADGELGAILSWGNNRHVGPIWVFSEFDDIAGISVWAKVPTEGYEKGG